MSSVEKAKVLDTKHEEHDIDFRSNNNDMIRHTKHEVNTDLSQMKIKILKTKAGSRTCEVNDFAELHWVAHIVESGKVVEDTK